MLLCPGPTVRVAVATPSGSMSVYALPLHLPLQLPIDKLPDTYGEVGGLVAGGYLFWDVSGHLEYPSNEAGPYAPTLASGVLDLSTGQEIPYPKLGAPMASANDQAYALTAHSHLLLWSHGAYQDLGSLPDGRVAAIDANGAVWADQPDEVDLYSDSLVMERPGSTATRSWVLHGAFDELGPGYMVFENTANTTHGTKVAIFFALVHKTINFTISPQGGPDFDLRPLGLDEVLTLYGASKSRTFLISL